MDYHVRGFMRVVEKAEAVLSRLGTALAGRVEMVRSAEVEGVGR